MEQVTLKQVEPELVEPEQVALEQVEPKQVALEHVAQEQGALEHVAQEQGALDQFQNIRDSLLEYSYMQITELLGIGVVRRNKWFITLQKGTCDFLLFRNEENDSLALYDISQNRIIPKDELFFEYFYRSSMREYEKVLCKVPVKNEFSIEQACKLDLMVGIYYGNYARSRFPETYQSFSSLTEDPWFKKFVTYNLSQKKFSLPLFNNSEFGVVNFVDFIGTTFTFRRSTPFSIFYPFVPSLTGRQVYLSDSYPDHTEEITENHLIISFNPFLLLSSCGVFRKSSAHCYPVLLETNLNTLKFARFVNLVHPSKFDLITILYSIEPEFYYQDLLNTMLFLIHFVNVYQTDYHFEYDYTNEPVFTLILTRYPPSVSVFEILELFNGINKCHQINLGTACYFIMEIPVKVEPVLCFCQWLINMYLKNIELLSVNGSDVCRTIPGKT